MNTLAAKVKEFWENLQGTYPDGEQIKAADDLASFFMEEGPRIEFGGDIDFPYEEDTLAELNDFEPNEEVEEPAELEKEIA